jgi:hypothetical protein
MTMAAVVVVAVLVIYPAFREYRYLRQHVGAVAHLRENRSQMDVMDGAAQITERAVGMEGLALAVAYRNQDGQPPPLGLQYQTFITYHVYGAPGNVAIGLEIGLFGGALLIAGPWALVAASLAVGMACRWTESLLAGSVARPELRGSYQAAAAIWLLHFLMFSGNLVMLAKEVLCMVLAAFVVRYAIRWSAARMTFDDATRREGRGHGASLVCHS